MSVFRDYTAFFGNGVGIVSPGGVVVRFGIFSGTINGLNQTFTAPEPLGTTKTSFKVFYNGVMIDPNDYHFVAPNIIEFITIVPSPPDRPVEYMLFGAV